MEVRQLAVREPGPGEVLVRVTLATICGSDLHMWRGEVPWFQKAPGIQGHEMVGSVAALGPGLLCRHPWMGNIVPGAEARIVPHDATRQPKMILGVLAYDRWVIPRALDWLARAQHRYPLARTGVRDLSARADQRGIRPGRVERRKRPGRPGRYLARA